MLRRGNAAGPYGPLPGTTLHREAARLDTTLGQAYCGDYSCRHLLPPVPGVAVTALALLLALASPAQADEPPVARAGAPFLAYPEERIILDGSASYDPEGYDLSFAWEQTHGPSVQLQAADTPNPEFDVYDPGSYTFQLIVNDGLQDSDPDAVDVIVVDPGIAANVDAAGCATTGNRGAGLLALLPGLLALASRRRHFRRRHVQGRH